MEKMPAADFDFRATAEQMTFGEQFTHVGYWSTFLLGSLTGAPPLAQPEHHGKDVAMGYFERASNHCAQIIDALSDEDLARRGIRPYPDWPDHTGEDLVIRAYMHAAHHRGQAVVYLRLKGIVPPPFDF